MYPLTRDTEDPTDIAARQQLHLGHESILLSQT
jgi:hypothetical protein